MGVLLLLVWFSEPTQKPAEKFISLIAFTGNQTRNILIKLTVLTAEL